MPIEKQAVFKIEKVDLDTGVAVVRYINKNGEIEKGKKTKEDFKQNRPRWTGNYLTSGEKQMEDNFVYDDNPNEDIVNSIDIPVVNGVYMTEAEFTQHVALMYPEQDFDFNKAKKDAPKSKELEDMVGKQYRINITHQDPVDLNDAEGDPDYYKLREHKPLTDDTIEVTVM